MAGKRRCDGDWCIEPRLSFLSLITDLKLPKSAAFIPTCLSMDRHPWRSGWGSESENINEESRRAKRWSGAADSAHQQFYHTRYCTITVARRFVTSNHRFPFAQRLCKTPLSKRITTMILSSTGDKLTNRVTALSSSALPESLDRWLT